MKRGLALFLSLAATAFGAEYSFELKPENTRIEWTLSDALHTVHGTFALASGQVNFDPSTGNASGRVVIDVTSGQSGSAARDKRMHANVLESKKYREAVFTPDRIVGKLEIPGSSEVKVHGVFTIHGASHELTMDARTQATTQATADSMKADLTFAIPYVEWGMKDPSSFLLKVNKTLDFAVAAAGALTRR
jgi:polyisoprenoid-binding protein YceI